MTQSGHHPDSAIDLGVDLPVEEGAAGDGLHPARVSFVAQLGVLDPIGTAKHFDDLPGPDCL